MTKSEYKLRTGEYGWKLNGSDVTDLWYCVAVQSVRLDNLLKREKDRGKKNRLEKRRRRLFLLGKKLARANAGELKL